MYAVGHFAIGYLTGKITAKALNTTINIPLLLLASVLPDIDLLMPALVHRGPLHSVMLYSAIFIPILIVYKKRAAPYFLAIIQHILIGDYITGPDLQLLWPLTNTEYGLQIGTTLTIVIEWAFFLLSMLVMIKSNDLLFLLKPHSSNMILTIPLMTVLLPTIISFPLYVPQSFHGYESVFN